MFYRYYISSLFNSFIVLYRKVCAEYGEVNPCQLSMRITYMLEIISLVFTVLALLVRIVERIKKLEESDS